ncbi:MAG: carboxypeptidase-like regulatory domain-containing protein [Prevotellaceae bacterium]|jgi:hypothetical protein|nr:carboxypeptidase-like regulatory domain-containing protein [Prevotellaceae bacterium]
MKLTNFLRTLAFAALLGSTMTMMISCNDEENPAGNDMGTITGTVTDVDTGTPIPDVTVTVSGMDEPTTTGSDGKYTVTNVTLESHAVSFSKAGWLTISVTVAANKFDANRVATVNASMQNASCRIVGVVTDAKNSNAPLAGVAVSIGPAGSVTTGADGAFAIENLIADDYTVEFTKANYATVTRQVSRHDFVNDVADLATITMGGQELLRGKTAEDLAGADKWYFDEYKGGRNGDVTPRWDWSTNYMGALDFWGNFEEQNEGSTLRIRNDEADQSNPADLNVFDSYVVGSKKIIADNKILTLRIRTHHADDAAPAHFGVQVIDLSEADPVAVKVGDNKTHGSDNYADYDFDLSAYVDKEVIIAIGVYRAQTGDYWKQLVLRRIAFASQKAEGGSWLSGTEVAGLEGWHMTREMLRSMMVNPNKSFTGISPTSGNRDNYIDGYRSWRTVNHLATNWFIVPVNKDPEPFPGEGYIIKTNHTANVSTIVPETYFAAKFAITADNDQLELKTRNFSSDNYTFFKLTAITEAGAVTHIQPSSYPASNAVAAENGCWKFIHETGGGGDPASYASFAYDLSSFIGSNVVLCLGVYNGAANTGENKMSLFSINME